MKHLIEGKITIDISCDIEAETKDEALKKAKKVIWDYYNFDVVNAYHDKDDIEDDLTSIEYEEEEM